MFSILTRVRKRRIELIFCNYKKIELVVEVPSLDFKLTENLCGKNRETLNYKRSLSLCRKLLLFPL